MFLILLKIREFRKKNPFYQILFFTAEVISEEVILKWYKEGHSVKGKMLFLDQMKKFIEWLQNAEEESESGEDDD